MRRHLLTLALVGALGVLMASDARACHKKRCPHPCPPPAPVCEVVPPPCPPTPVCVVEPTCAPAPKCGLLRHQAGCGHARPKLKLNLCHKRPACPPPAPVCCESAPVVYAAAQAVYAAPQAAPSAQVLPSGQ